MTFFDVFLMRFLALTIANVEYFFILDNDMPAFDGRRSVPPPTPKKSIKYLQKIL